ncbi:MAG: F0F1 ATP synthase subunit B family protein [Bdellovibrionota bacterium]
MENHIFKEVFPYFVNFTITIVLLVFMTRKSLRRYVYQRHERMKDAVESAAIAHQKALARIEAAKKAIDGAALEEQKLSANERLQVEQEKNEILQKSRDEATRQTKEAERLASAEREEAFDKVKEQFVAAVVSGTEQKLKQNLKKDDHSAIIKRAQASIEVGA